MTISYWIGYSLGRNFFEKHGNKIHMGPERLEKISEWFGKYGNKVIVIAFFIPGIRHITGYFSGITRLSFKTYRKYALIGSFIWVSVFISIGKLLGNHWEAFHGSVKKYFVFAGIIVGAVLFVVLVYRQNRNEIQGTIFLLLNQFLNHLHSRRRVAVLLGAIALVTIALIVLMGGIIQDFIAGEFHDFNKVVTLLVPSVFTSQWKPIMSLFTFLGSNPFLVFIIVFTFALILWRGQNKILEMSMFIFIFAGGELYEEVIRVFFHNWQPVRGSFLERIPYGFPNEQSLSVMVIFGGWLFTVFRHSKRAWVHSFTAVLTIGVLLMIAVSRIYFSAEVPGYIAAGYVFGAVWLGVNFLLLEIFRILEQSK
jgi:membrane protein DedA with SNARE-associated domain